MIAYPTKVTEVNIDEALKASLQQSTEGVTIVHCTYINFYQETVGVRIWQETVLEPDNGDDAKLLHAIGITVAPEWMFTNKYHVKFTLIFERLPSQCKWFNMVERINEQGAFTVMGIQRNESDVYRIDIQ